MKKFRKFLFLLMLISILVTSLRAEIMVARSVESLACEADIIVFGKITNIAIAKAGADWPKVCTVKVEDWIKGDQKKTELEFHLHSRWNGKNVPDIDILNSEKGLLIFLNKDEMENRRVHPDPERLVPTSGQCPLSVIDLSSMKGMVFSKDMTVVKDADRLLEITKEWAKSAITHSISMKVPYDAPIHSKLYAGSVCYLMIPGEEKWREYCLKQARDQNGFWEVEDLQAFPGEDTEKILQDIIAEDNAIKFVFQDTRTSVYFCQKIFARETLRKMGKEVPKINEHRKLTEKEKAQIAQKLWTKRFEQALREFGGKVVSVSRGRVLPVSDLYEVPEITVNCSVGEKEYVFTIVPKKWKREIAKDQVFLGCHDENECGKRCYFCPENLPVEVREKIIAWFYLKNAE